VIKLRKKGYTMNYSPNITEAHHPEDGGWTEENGIPVLLLSIPSLGDLIPTKIDKYSYAWLYEKEMEAYIFCVQVNNRDEFGVIFSREEAGQLLLDAEAYGEFTVIICKEAFDQLEDDTPFLTFPKISLTRSVLAGW
jgi:hypothetical protein